MTRSVQRLGENSLKARLVTLAAIGAVLAAFGTLSAVAQAPAVVGKVTGRLPAPSRALVEIRAFDAASARVVAKATVSRTGAFRLALDPGGYVLITSVVPRRGRSGAVASRVTPLTLAPGQRRTDVTIALPRGRAGHSAGRHQEGGAITPGRIAFSVERFTGATGDLGVMNRGLADLLQTDLSSTPCRTALVATASDRAVIEGELGFQRSRYVDPSTRVVRNFVTPDIVVRGRLQTRGTDLVYTLVLVDRRTGRTLETLSSALRSDYFAAAQQLAARLARRLCTYGEVFEVTFTGTGTGNFATHSASGTLSATPITARPVAKDAGGATRWEGSAPVSWTKVVITSTTECSYVDPVSGGTRGARLARVGESLEVEWLADKGATGTATVMCRGFPVPGQPTTSLIGSQPARFRLPATAMRPVRGGLQDQGYGWDNVLELKVRTIRVEPLP
jgi:hypothetical protein